MLDDAKVMHEQMGKRMVNADLLDKFPDIVNGHRLSDQDKTLIILEGTSGDLDNRKISLDPNFSILYYATPTFSDYGGPHYSNRIIKQSECSYQPMQNQKSLAKTAQKKPKKDKGTDMGI